jgi:mRNA interferase MazF
VGKPIAGEVIIVPFPQTNLVTGKLRPALTLVSLPGDDVILRQITSQARHDGYSIALSLADFGSGSLPIASFIRPNRLFTADKSVIVRSAGQVKAAKLQQVLAAVRDIFS